MRKFYNWINNFWWILLIVILVAYIIVVSILNISDLNRITTTIFNYINQIIAPLGVIIGLILGYPLLKQKLADIYVSKQLEIIHDNNRILRKECLRLKEKYPISHVSQKIDKEYVETLFYDVKKLNELAIDANPDAYKYSFLLYKSIHLFNEKIKRYIPNNGKEHYFQETLSCYAHNHIEQVFEYAKTIGFVPKNSTIKKRQIVTTKLNKYVTDNNYYQIEGVDFPFSYKHTSALLVRFFSTNNICLSINNGLLFQCNYEVAPSPSPFARIMFNHNIYMPLVLESEKFMNIVIPKLVFVGYVRQKSTKIESGISTHYLICHYANISSFGFVDGTIKDRSSLLNYQDTYLKNQVLDIDDIEEFIKNGERLIIKIAEQNAMKYFNQIKKLLSKKMNTEKH